MGLLTEFAASRDTGEGLAALEALCALEGQARADSGVVQLYD